MTQLIGGLVVLAALLILGGWAWKTWGKGSSVGQTTGGQIVTAAVDTATLTLNLGYVEMLSKVDVIKASPDAAKACDTLATILWQGAQDAWKAAQTAATTTAPAVQTAKVTTVDGKVVEVPVS